jgi:Acyl-CoA synthetases (AMP-forming)/AMP-acid ligases II
VIEAALKHGDDRQALIAPERGVRLSHGALAARVEEVAEQLRDRFRTRRLVMLAPGPDVEAVLVYLGCLRAGLPVCLAEPQPAPLARLARVYAPALILTPDSMPAPEGWQPSPCWCQDTWRSPAGCPVRPCIPTSPCSSRPRGPPAAPSWCGSRCGTWSRMRGACGISGARGARAGHPELADALQLRLVGPELASGCRRQRRAHAALVHASRVLARGRRSGGDLLRRRALHV